jgi:TonB family protein
MDLIDPEFQSRSAEPGPERAPEGPRPGAGSEILPREESEALARAHDVTLESPDDAAIDAAGAGKAGEPAMAESLEDEFSRLRAKMEADVEAEKRARLDAEREEASQRARLEQWMANARARLLKADADLAGPGSRVRIRKESSPSLYRLAEMQKTMIVEGDATVAQSPNGTVLSDGRGRTDGPPDPMATISVPAEQFMAAEAPPEPTLREQALARQAVQQAAAQQSSRQQARARHLPLAQAPQAAAASGETGSRETPATAQRTGPLAPASPQPLTREQALTRKVAQLRKAAEDASESAPMAIPGEAPERTALRVAIAAVVVVAIGVLTLALYAATQAGLFDGLENRIPLLRPKMSVQQILPKRPTLPAPAPAQAAPDARSAGGAPARSGQTVPGTMGSNAVTGAAAVTGTTAATPGSAASAPARASAVNADPSRTAAAKAPVTPAPVPANGIKGAKAAVRPAVQASASPARPKTAAAAAAADEDGEIPAYAKARPQASNLAEIILNASVQAAYNIDADNFREMYNRYALGFPGLSGEVVLGLTVDPGGRVLQGSIISSTTGAEEFDQEILKKVLDWKLRAFPDTRPRFVKVPFLFPMQDH